MKITPNEQKVLNAVHRHDKSTCADIAATLRMTTDNVGRVLRILVLQGLVYVVARDASKPRMPKNIYSCKPDIDFSVLDQEVKKKATQVKQDEARKAFTKRNTYDPDAPVMPNNGWVSTIHSKDYVMQHGEHIKYMERFQPHPDQASTWLFNEPKVELLGARYDLV